MAQPTGAMAGDLHLHRVRVMGRGATRDSLASALGGVRLPPLAEDELLYIPRHRCRAVLRPGAPGFAHAVSAEIRHAFSAALIDPPPGVSAAAYRFTSRGTFAIWAFGTWLAQSGGEAEARGVFATLPGGGPLAWARREVLDEGGCLPAVGAALAREGQGARWLARLDPADRARMRQALRRSHGLPSSAVWGEGRPDGVAEVARAVTATASAALRAGNALATLPQEAVELLLALLQLAVDPSTPRAALAAAVSMVAAGTTVPPLSATGAAGPGETRAAAGKATTSALSEGATPQPSPPRSSQPHLEVSPPLSAPSRSVPPSRSASQPRRALSPPASQSPTASRSRSDPQRRAALGPRSDAEPEPAQRLSAPSAQPVPAAQPAPAAQSQPPSQSLASVVPVSHFPTDFAGLWFVCNAFLALGLYGDFSRPTEGMLALAPSRLLDRLALRWFGSRYRGDPLHKALGRSGADPPLPRRWQVESAWLEAFAGEEGAAMVTSHSHQTLWHPAGFPLADSPLPGPTRRHADRRDGRPVAGPRDGSKRRAPAAPPGLSRQLPSAHPARWLACLALYLDARILRATGDPALGLSSLALPGHCRIGPERVDVDLALADLPLPLRLAGLDRDPGWLPAEGRAIAFHFQ